MVWRKETGGRYQGKGQRREGAAGRSLTVELGKQRAFREGRALNLGWESGLDSAGSGSWEHQQSRCWRGRACGSGGHSPTGCADRGPHSLLRQCLLHVHSQEDHSRPFQLQIHGSFHHTAVCTFGKGRKRMPDFFPTTS